MKRYGVVGMVLGMALAVAFSMRLLPAQAEESSVEGAWEITVASYSSGDKPRLAVVKHNRVTGRTLIVTCDNRCNPDERWSEFSVAGSD
jgi:hypothetical protein